MVDTKEGLQPDGSWIQDDSLVEEPIPLQKKEKKGKKKDKANQQADKNGEVPIKS
ncbi:hypothetical protein ACFLU4_01885 [Chloroflexota bacterium]